MVENKAAKAEAASLSIEVTLTSMDNVGKTGVDMKALEAEKGNAISVLRDENVWICDTGLSMHLTWSSKCTRSVRETHTCSFRQTGGAVESTAIIDIPGVFTSRHHGTEDLLNDCSYNKEHNFNLLSLLRLLHKQGWKITQGDESLIRIENEKGGVINFDIIWPTAKGAIYACKFMREAEVISTCMDTGAQININNAHCLLGHRNEHIRKP
jgi:hypothetical protein